VQQITTSAVKRNLNDKLQVNNGDSLHLRMREFSYAHWLLRYVCYRSRLWSI